MASDLEQRRLRRESKRHLRDRLLTIIEQCARGQQERTVGYYLDIEEQAKHGLDLLKEMP